MKISPVVFFAYNRPYHTIKSLSHLKKNKLASKTDLLIFIDGPKNNSEDKIRVKLVCDIVKKIDGFKSKKIFFRKNNLGLSKNFISGISQILKKYESVIVIEDDNLVSKYFLDYINQGLNLFKNDNNICAINGYSYPINKKNLPNHFLVKGADTWGWGTWRRAWNEIIWNPKTLLKKINNKKILKKKINLLKAKIDKKNDSYTIMFDLSMQIKKKYSLVPKIPYSINCGLDGSGRHAKKETNIFNSKTNEKKIKIDKKKIFINQLYEERLKNFYKRNLLLDYKYKIKMIEIIKRVIGKKIENKIKNTLLRKNKIEFKENKNGKYINYLDNSSYIKKNFNLLELSKKNFFLTVKDGKLRNINNSNFFILDKLKDLVEKYNSKLNIIELGGGVGQKYLEFRKLIGENFSFNWNIIEQKKYLDYLKRKKFSNLRLSSNLDNLTLNSQNPCVLIFSTSMQYIKDPYCLINKINNNNKIKYLLIENAPLSEKKENKLLQRHYSYKKIFYSFYLFNKIKFMKEVKKKFKLKEKILSENINSKNSKFSFDFYDLFLVR